MTLPSADFFKRGVCHVSFSINMSSCTLSLDPTKAGCFKMHTAFSSMPMLEDVKIHQMLVYLYALVFYSLLIFLFPLRTHYQHLFACLIWVGLVALPCRTKWKFLSATNCWSPKGVIPLQKLAIKSPAEPVAGLKEPVWCGGPSYYRGGYRLVTSRPARWC